MPIKQQAAYNWQLFVKWTGVILALIAAIAPPLVYFWLNTSSQRAAIHTEAEINARLFTALINKNPDFWQYEQLRFSELLNKRPSIGNRLEYRELFDINGKMIAESKDNLPSPLMTEKAEVFDAGRAVGSLHITRSLRPLLVDSIQISILSFLFGVLLLYILHIPLRYLRASFSLLREEKERAMVTLRSIGDAVITTDAEGNIQIINNVAMEMTGWTNEEAAGLPVHKVLDIVYEDTNDAVEGIVHQCLHSGKAITLQNNTTLIRKKNHRIFHIEESAAPIRHDSGEVIGVVLVIHDVTERKQTEKQLLQLAYQDPLTGLANRTQFQNQLDKAISYGKRHNRLVALLYMDIDRFKEVNDSLGHAIGDQLLLEIAVRLKQCIRTEDTLARLGGDEFTIILENQNQPLDAAAVAQQVNDALKPAFIFNGQEFFISASIGIAIFPNDADRADTLLKNADVAMYQAKELGRNNYQFYTNELNKIMIERVTLVNALRHALDRNEFLLEYQPKLDLLSNKIVGAEALLRWESPTLGRVMPLKFISLLEDTGLIVPVGKWIIQTAAEQSKKLLDAGLPIRISINLSARQFLENDLIDCIAKTLAQTNLPSQYLEAEITESLLLDDSRKVLEILNKLNELGIMIALDDFGTGYSSLSYLKRYPIDIVKIDRSFVQDLTENIEDSAISSAIITMSHTLKMDVIAEGVETQEQATYLKNLGCNEIQGYWLSRPMPAKDLQGWLKAYAQNQDKLSDYGVNGSTKQ